MGKIIYLLLTLFSLQANANVILLQEEANKYISDELLYFHDPGATLSFEEVKSKPFRPIKPSGFFPGHMWARGELCYTGNEQLYLIYKDPIEEVDFYVEKIGFKGEHRFLGPDKLASSFWLVMKFSLNGCSNVYLKVKSEDVVNFNYLVTTESNFSDLEVSYATFYGIFYAVIILSLLASIFFYFLTKKYMYLFFASILIFQDLLGASLLSGYLFRFFVTTNKFIEYDLGNIFAPLMNASLVLFAISFLTIKPRIIRYISYGFIGSQLVVVVPILLSIILPIHKQNFQVSEFVNLSILGACFWVIILAGFAQKNKITFYFLIATVPKVVGQFIKTLLLQGDFPIDAFGPNGDFLCLTLLS